MGLAAKVRKTCATFSLSTNQHHQTPLAMRSTFASRRPKARIVGRNDEGDDLEENQPLDTKAAPLTPSGRPVSGMYILRIALSKRARCALTSFKALGGSSSRSKAKKRSSLRLSFGPGGTSAADDDEETVVFTPKKSALSRKAIEKNASRKSGLSVGIGVEQLSSTPTVERPTYSKEYLEELRSSTPTAPVAEDEDLGDVDMIIADPTEPMEDNMLSKPDAPPMQGTVIPDEGLVRIMKARRAEKAAKGKRGDYISLDASDDDDGGGILLKSRKKKESRLQRADDGMFDEEELEEYVEDGRIVLGGKSAQREHDRKRRQGIREAINEAEGLHDDNDIGADSDVSRDSLAEEWERDQIKKGAFLSNSSSSGITKDLEMLSKKPPQITPLPNLVDALRSLQETLGAMELRKAQTVRQMEALRQEKEEIAQREAMVQERLQRASEEYEKLRGSLEIGGAGPGGVVDRGLESFGNTPVRATEI